MTMPVLIIGGGAAAFGVAAGIFDRFGQSQPIIILRPDDQFTTPDNLPFSDGDKLDSDQIETVYGQIRQSGAKGGFPPPKSVFGQFPETAFETQDGHKIHGALRGGTLTRYWGAGMLPALPGDMPQWAKQFGEIEAAYKSLLGHIEITGDDDAITGFLGAPYHNRVYQRPVFGKPLTQSRPAGDFQALEGVARIAVSQGRSGCFNCGECMIGCPADAIWSADKGLSQLIAKGGNIQFMSGQVQSFDKDHLYLEDAKPPLRLADYSAVYLAAGTLGSGQIMLNSRTDIDQLVFHDTPVLSFPITGNFGYQRAFKALANKMVLIEKEGRSQLLSIYPYFDHLSRFYLPRSLWGLNGFVSLMARGHLAIGRLYAHQNNKSAFSMKKGTSTNGSGFQISAINHGCFDFSLERQMIKQLFSSPLNRFLQKAISVQYNSSHYASSLYNIRHKINLAADGHLFDNLFVADASVFPELPSISPTYTIMAHGYRLGARMVPVS